MKRLLVVIVALLVLGAVVPGCGGASHYDGRLTAADSLMRNYPDSALAIIEAVNRDSLITERDRAYRDLLLTQARYKANITATTDSGINRAVAFYRAHPKDREKLTRAYIYKGAVMEELGFPDSAMHYFKTAEKIAGPDDYSNLGYIKMQMGALYNDYYSFDGLETLKYEEALESFRMTHDSAYIFLCLNNLGCMYRENLPEKADSMLLEASQIARNLQDTSYIIYNDLSLAVLYYYQGKYQQARRLFQEMFTFNNPTNDYVLFFTAAKVYARLGVLDTAEMYHDIACDNHYGDESLYRMHYLRSLSELALARKDTVASIRLSMESDRIDDSLTSNHEKFKILNTEVTHDKESVENNLRKHKSREKSFILLIVAMVILLTLVLLLVYCMVQRYIHRYDELIADLQKENQNQSDNLKTLQNNIDNLRIDDDKLRAFFNSHMNMMREMIEECYHTPHGPLAKNIRQIVKYQEENTGIWNKLYSYLDMEYNNIMSSTMERFPQLGDKDLLMIALTCVGYTCAQIAIVLGYSSSSGISTIRKRIASKMGLDCLLSEYIDQFKS